MWKAIAAALLALAVLGAVGVPPARSVDRDAVQQAVNRGVAVLRGMQRPTGEWPEHHGVMGTTALAGITLLKCGADPTDKAVTAAAAVVRRESAGTDRIYSIALGILFLDMLGDPRDVPLIESLMVRLLAGQGGKGGWSYTCPPTSKGETRRLTALVRDRGASEMKTRPDDGGAGAAKKTFRDLGPETRKKLARLVAEPAFKGAGDGDNSNTQFATLALWVGRRYGVPVEDALARIAARYRLTQVEDGGWAYNVRPDVPAGGQKDGAPMPPGMTVMSGGSSPTMTCAGVLALLVSHGAVAEARQTKARNLDGDVQLGRGLAALAEVIGDPGGDRTDAKVPDPGGRTFYFLWSLERVCMALGTETLGKKDWYSWGAEILLHSQQPDGSWKGEFAASGADTCFALLFLKKANLTRDLTGGLQGQWKDGALLRSGGVGGEGVLAGPPRPTPPTGGSTKPEPERTHPADAKAGGSPPAEAPAGNVAPSALLADALLKAAPADQGAIIQGLQEARGVANTEALAFAIPRLDGEVKKKAREALTARLVRLKAESLLKYLEDEEAEIRRAAALACAAKGLETAIPKLISRLDDREENVRRAAHAALKELTRQDPGANRADWEAWWKKQGKE
jgi:hypothetical protein